MARRPPPGFHRGSRGLRGCDPAASLGGVGVERRREIPYLSLRPSETTFWSGAIGDFPHVLQVHPQSGDGATSGNFSASLTPTPPGGDAAGGWGRTRGLGPRRPPGTRGGLPGQPAGPHLALYLILPHH